MKEPSMLNAYKADLKNYIYRRNVGLLALQSALNDMSKEPNDLEHSNLIDRLVGEIEQAIQGIAYSKSQIRVYENQNGETHAD